MSKHDAINTKYQQISNLLNKSDDFPYKIVIKKCIKIKNRCTNSKTIEFINNVVRLSFCNFSDSYIVVGIKITSTSGNALIFKNWSPVISFITEINKSWVDEAQSLI